MGTTETWSYNGYFGAGREIELVPGVLDEAARDVFCRGHCHSLALALIELIPDAELVAVCRYDDPVADHILVRLPDGGLLDANGLRYDDDEITGPYGWEAFLDTFGDEEMEWLQETENYRAARVEDAMPFARALIAREAISELAFA